LLGTDLLSTDHNSECNVESPTQRIYQFILQCRMKCVDLMTMLPFGAWVTKRQSLSKDTHTHLDTKQRWRAKRAQRGEDPRKRRAPKSVHFLLPSHIPPATFPSTFVAQQRPLFLENSPQKNMSRYHAPFLATVRGCLSTSTYLMSPY
jgi:hypothetical protein